MGDSSGHDRRKLTRVKADTISPLAVAMPGITALATAVDISAFGIGFISTHWLEERSEVTIGRRGPRAGKKLLAEVRHVAEHEGTGWLVGCRFLKMLSADDILDLG